MWRAGAVLFPYCSVPEKGQPCPTTLNILNRHLAIFAGEQAIVTHMKEEDKTFLMNPKILIFNEK